MRARTLSRLHPRAGPQRGVYALEFSLVFLTFFMVVYACICYAILFTYRFALQTAAEEGARAGLIVQTVASGSSQVDNRVQIAGRVAQARLAGWLPQGLPPTVDACVRKLGEANCATSLSDCHQASTVCQITVRVAVSGVNALLPSLVPLPNTLTGQASLQLDRRTL